MQVECCGNRLRFPVVAGTAFRIEAAYKGRGKNVLSSYASLLHATFSRSSVEKSSK